MASNTIPICLFCSLEQVDGTSGNISLTKDNSLQFTHIFCFLFKQLADEGDRSQAVSSEHGECLQCLQERLSQLGSSPKSPPPSPVVENPPPSPPPLHSPVFHTSIYDLPPPPLVSTSSHSPISPDGADHSIFRSPLVTPISMNCTIMAASTPTSKAIVVYKPPFSLLRECFEGIIDTEVCCYF